MIIDDQKESVELLVDHVKKIQSLDLKMATTDPIEGLSFLDNDTVDLIFLDVQMPEITGLDFIESIKEKFGNQHPQVIFTTGFDDYAISGFEYGVIDYLTKPISFKRFKKSVDRFINLSTKNNQKEEEKEEVKFFFADMNGKKVKINFDDILYVEGARNYLFIVTPEKKIIILKSMTALEKVLPAKQFMRVHKSYIVSFDNIQAIKGNEITVEMGELSKNIPVGVTYRENVLKRLKIID